MKQNHTHKLKRFVYNNGTKIYFCTLPDCSFRISIGLALGKRTICWRCSNEFNMNTYSLTLAKPHCEDCHVHRGASKEDSTKKSQPVSVISESIANDAVSSLKDRLHSVMYKPLEEKDEDL